LIGYDQLKMAREICDLSPNLDPKEWALAEGISYDELLKFGFEESDTVFRDPMVAAVSRIDPRACFITGLVMGLRYANILHTAGREHD
jgi:hypothetical protein